MPGHQGYNPIRTMDNSSSIVEGGTSPSAHSSQQLMSTDTESISGGSDRNRRLPEYSDNIENTRTTFMDWFTVGVLCFVNLINYMDRFTVAGVLTDIQDTYNIGDDKGGLLQTAFILSYMICAPIFGYLGDRYSRRLIMAIGVLIWSGTTVIGSFMNQFGWFIMFRALVGVGEASYSTIAPTIISDLFVHNMRSKMLALFYFAIPVGSGLGYIIGSETANLLGSWRWALRVTPFLGAIAVVLLLLIKEPERGQSEGSLNMEVTSYREDLRDLIKNKTFMLTTCGFTCVAFVAGALSWWGPKFIYRGLLMQPENQTITQNDVSYRFGIIAMFAGLIGVPLGSFISQKLRPTNGVCDPLICAFGLIVSAPLVYLSLILPKTSEFFCYFFVFFAEISLNLCWSLVADMLLYVVIPTRRSTAEAFQILISHMFGDAGSPYLIGVISEAIKSHMRSAVSEVPKIANISTVLPVVIQQNRTITDFESNQIEFQSLQYALFATSFVEILGGIFFFISAMYILKDKVKASQAIKENQAVPNHIYADSS